MRLVDKIRLLAEFSPLLAIAQDIAATTDRHEQAMLVLKALDWLSDRTDVKVDDSIVFHARAVLGTDEGRDAFNAAVEGIKALLKKGE